MRIDVILDPDSSPGEVHELGLLAEHYGLGAVWVSVRIHLIGMSRLCLRIGTRVWTRLL